MFTFPDCTDCGGICFGLTSRECSLVISWNNANGYFVGKGAQESMAAVGSGHKYDPGVAEIQSRTRRDCPLAEKDINSPLWLIVFAIWEPHPFHAAFQYLSKSRGSRDVDF
ncbi:hypothetical protein J6590_003728 [Homalodisca vitripennis]|nr:hypothetical protein J6590_003728 [Homalodisca vitripennis]